MTKRIEPAMARRPEREPLPRPARLGDEAYEAIFQRIMALAIPPGARITVDGLARELGVSQTPIREALARLESDGLVSKQHLVGYRAAPQMTHQQFEDTYEMRLLLEPPSAGRAAERICSAALYELEALANEMQALDRLDGLDAYARFAQLDAQFHNRVAAAAGNELIVEALARLHAHVHLFRLLHHARVTEAALDEHRVLLDALSRHEPAAAIAAMRDHLLRSRERFEATYSG